MTTKFGVLNLGLGVVNYELRNPRILIRGLRGVFGLRSGAVFVEKVSDFSSEWGFE